VATLSTNRETAVHTGTIDSGRLVRVAMAAGGVAVFSIIAVLLRDKWTVPGGDVAIFLGAGADLWAGVNPYDIATNPTQPWLYGPPWVVVFAVVSLLGSVGGYLAVVAAEVASLRYMTGSWMRVAYLGWIPLLPFEVLGGGINLIVAASIVASVRGDAWLALMGSFAKLSPMAAADPRDWRRYVVPLAVIAGVTVPWLWLWPAWVESLVAVLQGPPLGHPIPVPLWVRAPVALALILTGRPWARALGAAIAIPAFYWISLLVLIAPLSVRLWSGDDEAVGQDRVGEQGAWRRDLGDGQRDPGGRTRRDDRVHVVQRALTNHGIGRVADGRQGHAGAIERDGPILRPRARRGDERIRPERLGEDVIGDARM
jgi:hypothetical protein